MPVQGPKLIGFTWQFGLSPMASSGAKVTGDAKYV